MKLNGFSTWFKNIKIEQFIRAFKAPAIVFLNTNNHKIKKVLPYWLITLVALVAIQISLPMLLGGKKQVDGSGWKVPAKPAVLGAFTYARGEEVKMPAPKPPVKKLDPDFADVSADSFLVYDTDSGEVLAEKDSSRAFFIASLTKLMTALVAYDHTDLNRYYEIKSTDKLSISPVLRLKENDQVQAWDLFNAMLVGSANDAARSLADFVSVDTGKDFVELMNQKAKELGMADSHFSNPLGFDSKYNYSTAQDLKKIVEHIQNLPAFKEVGRKTSYEFQSKLGNVYRITASNKLIRSNQDMEAVKTGYTKNANGAMITKVTRNNHQIVLIVLSSQNREGDTLKLGNEIFKAYEWQDAQ